MITDLKIEIFSKLFIKSKRINFDFFKDFLGETFIIIFIK